MKIVTINKKLLAKFRGDPEVLQKPGRPCVLVIRLKYKGRNQDFAVPLQSNMSASTPKEQYFPLPPGPATKPRNRHGLHYIKMFPVTKQHLVKYRTQGNNLSITIQTVIDNNEKRIVRECQSYLSRYETGSHPPFSTDIDYLLSQLYSAP